ncbi:uncharacterized protein MKK02DRAFT_32064 [Dioszegia hungarica]|uniref:BTB domain-containing protein n=1 Tax=Dioszegia hungarica TaxID=4972 RepID=A0AA38HFK6_9TREE|nr:uncharacterized protein MKK02DRAFT_32064 [Dioszegia hungarica]KAI9638674.1 hypothetical protein MKK02DRAFT_32064 [Dioszegia hungarica]
MSGSTEYTDAKGVVYALQAGYEHGEIAILSDDKAAWRVSQAVLTEASPVFKDMFAGSSASPKEVNLPSITRAQLDLFIRSIHGRSPLQPPSFSEASEVVELLIRYDCAIPARQLLFRTVKDIRVEDHFEALAFASRLDDLKSACRIISQGWKWWAQESEADSRSLCPDHLEVPRTAEDAGRIRSSWVWALTLASGTLWKRPDLMVRPEEAVNGGEEVREGEDEGMINAVQVEGEMETDEEDGDSSSRCSGVCLWASLWSTWYNRLYTFSILSDCLVPIAEHSVPRSITCTLHLVQHALNTPSALPPIARLFLDITPWRISAFSFRGEASVAYLEQISWAGPLIIAYTSHEHVRTIAASPQTDQTQRLLHLFLHGPPFSAA